MIINIGDDILKLHRLGLLDIITVEKQNDAEKGGE